MGHIHHKEADSTPNQSKFSVMSDQPIVPGDAVSPSNVGAPKSVSEKPAPPKDSVQNARSQHLERHALTHYDEESNIAVPSPVAVHEQITRNHSKAVSEQGSEFSSWSAEKANLYHTNAKEWSSKHSRPKWTQRTFEYTCYILLLACLYLFFVGLPLWHGAIYGFWVLANNTELIILGTAVFWGLAALYAIAPLLCCFQRDPVVDEQFRASNLAKAHQTSLIIPCYKSAAVIAVTLEAALRIFPPSNIFVVDNGNSPTPVDNTEEICRRYGVRYFWVSTGSKIVAQFIGCQAAAELPYTLLIDDDCTLPEVFPLRTERIQLGSKKGMVKCIGYAITSVGTGGSKGTFCQQAQDLEYKLAGMGRYFFGKWGSAKFPHGAIALWDREFLSKCFAKHPGYTISEDWWFGHVSRTLGGRIQMCNEVFVQTETPPALIRKKKNTERSGYGEMTVVRQRTTRWNFFLVSRLVPDTKYIVLSWNMSIFIVGAKVSIFQEMYESLLLLTYPIITPVLLATNPIWTIYIMFAVIGMYVLTVVIFNEAHLRRKKAMVSRRAAYLYYPPYKTFLRLVNVFSVYRAIYMYARYFRSRHPKVIENELAMSNLVRIINQEQSRGNAVVHESPLGSQESPPRNSTVRGA